MTAKFFVIADRSGRIAYQPAERTIAHNLEAHLAFDTRCAETVLAQADTAEKAQRFVDLLSAKGGGRAKKSLAAGGELLEIES